MVKLHVGGSEKHIEYVKKHVNFTISQNQMKKFEKVEGIIFPK